MKKYLFSIILFLLSICTASAQVDFIFGKQFGTSEDDKTRNLVTDSLGNIYVLGKTKGAIGEENYGKNDGFILKIDSTANIIWAKQIGSTEDDELVHATIDRSGNIYIIGVIGVDEKNTSDVLVAKLDTKGEIIWEKQFGTDSTDIGANIVIDKNEDIYIIGYTKGSLVGASHGKNDCFILHLDKYGNKLNAVQFGTPGNDVIAGITLGQNSKIYVCGATEGNMVVKNKGAYDLIWGIFSKELKQLEMKQFGTNEGDMAGEIKIDNQNNVYVSGCTFGNAITQQKGNGDALLQKWNGNGELIWTKQFGTSNWDGMHSIAIIPYKGIVVSGCYDYPLCKSFIKMYNEGGSLLWQRNIVAQGTGGGSCGKDVCINRQGYIYHAGYTGANLFSDLRGEHDLYLIKLKPEIE